MRGQRRCIISTRRLTRRASSLISTASAPACTPRFSIIPVCHITTLAIKYFTIRIERLDRFLNQVIVFSWITINHWFNVSFILTLYLNRHSETDTSNSVCLDEHFGWRTVAAVLPRPLCGRYPPTHACTSQ